MIANQTKGKGFGGALKYLLSKEDARIIGGNMMGENIKELTSEFKKSRELRPNLQKCVWHASLSLPHDESLTNEKWHDLGAQYANKMGFNDSQFVIVRHYDTKHEHVHILASRVSLDGEVVSDSNDYRRSETIVRSLEKAFGLTPTISSREVGRKAFTKGELHKAIREQKPSIKILLQQHVDVAKRDQPDVTTFIDRLESQSVGVIPNMAKNGTITGISFYLNGEIMKGSDLGRDYSWNNLIKQGEINYDGKYSNDYEKLISAKIRSRDLYHQGRGKDDQSGDFRFYKELRKSIKTSIRGYLRGLQESTRSDSGGSKYNGRLHSSTSRSNRNTELSGLYSEAVKGYNQGRISRHQIGALFSQGDLLGEHRSEFDIFGDSGGSDLLESFRSLNKKKRIKKTPIFTELEKTKERTPEKKRTLNLSR